MAGTLHLHTDGLANSSSTTTSNRQYGGYQYQAGGGAATGPNEADYAAVTPTAARPHPESSRSSSHMSLFDAFIPPQYAYPQSSSSMMATTSPFPVYQQQQQHPVQQQDNMTPGVYLNARQSQSSYPALSSCSSSSESSAGTGGPSTPPPSSTGSSPSLLAFSSTGIPGNTIYNAYNNSNNMQMNAYPQYNHLAYSGSSDSMVAMQPTLEGHHYHNGQFIQQHSQQQACGFTNTTQYAPVQSAYPPYQSGFHNNQYAIYNGNGNEVNVPSVLQAGPAGNTSQPTSAQISPNMAYNTIQMNDTTNQVLDNNLPSVLSSINVDAFTAVDHTANAEFNKGNFQSYQEQQPSFRTYQHHGQGHSHSASLSSISSTNSLSGSPAPSLSGSDDSGNTSKSTVSRLSIISGNNNNDNNRSNPSSRRGSVSSNAGAPYSLSSRKDKDGGDKKFVCSYPGCSRAFSRNFNLSTHYNTHLGIKPFPCTHCPKSFSRRHDCARHIAAVHASEPGKPFHTSDEAAGPNLSPTSCGCGHTCPAHKFVPSYEGTTVIPTSYNGAMRTPSAFSFIKGEPMEDDLLSSTSSSSTSGYESTTSSIDSFIGRFGALDATTTNISVFNNNQSSMNHDNSRSPSLSAFSNNTGYIDVGRIKIEDGEGE